jgi:hypothetical protein
VRPAERTATTLLRILARVVGRARAFDRRAGCR